MSLETLFQDIRYALRGLRSSPGFTLTAVTALSLGIGANTAVFSIVHALLFRAPAGVGDFDRVASVYTSDFSGPPYGSSSYLDIQDYASGAPSFSGIAAYSIQMAVLNDAAGGRPAELVGGQAVTGNYFDVLRIPMAAGRSFTAEERRPEGPSAVVLANAFWRTRFGGDPSVLGQTIRISGNPFTVVGVAPAGFNGLFAAVTPSFFVPIETTAPLFGIRLEERGARGLFTVGRLVDGATPEQAGAELAVVAGRLFGAFPEAWTDRTSQQRRVTVIPTSQALLPPQARGAANAFAALLMGVVAAVLLICCANLANLLLVRATTRQREIGVRLALGAGRARIIRQLITESMVLAGAGVIGGVALAYAGTRALGNARLPLPIPVPVRIDATPDFRVLGFAVLVSLVAGLLFGLAPALIATRDAVASSIGTDRAIGGSSGRQMRLRYALAGGQIAIAVTLLVMAGLLVRSLRSAQAMDPGFRTAGMLFVNMAEDEKTTTPEQRLAFHRSLRDQVGALPGVRGVSYVSALPLGGGRGRRGYRAEGYTPAPQEEIEIDFTESGPGYLDAMGIQLRAGRDFAEADGPDAPRVAIVNESFARRYFAGTNPVGMRLNVGRPTEAEIVGVVADGKYRSLGEDPLPFVYVPLDQTSSPVVTLVIQAPGQLAGLDEAVRRLVSAEAPDVAITSVANADEHLSLALMPQRAGSAALGLFGLLGLALASLGVYGVTSYTVERRSHEIGVRLALGAKRGDVVRMIVGKGMIVALLGAAVGLTAAAGLSQLLGFLLFGIEPLDAISFLGAGAVVAVACLLANWLPAQRSARLSPASILKGD